MRTGITGIRHPKTWLKLIAASVVFMVLLGLTSPPEDTQAIGIERNAPRGSNIVHRLHEQHKHNAFGPFLLEMDNDGAVQNNLVVYNRVPKCASTSTRSVFSFLAKHNNVTVFSSKIYAKEILNITEQEELVKDVTKMMTKRGPLVFIRHFFFVNFTKFGVPQPVYINVVRDPLERHVSDYYYKRLKLASMFHMETARKNRTYNECVLGNYTECVGDTNQGYFRVIPYFCGQDPKCFTASRWALERAKSNVVTQYAMVGTVERLTDSLAVLERLLPGYFSTASFLYTEHEKQFRKMAKTPKKDSLTAEVTAIMKNLLKYDYEFYEYIKQRLHTQWTRLLRTSSEHVE